MGGTFDDLIPAAILLDNPGITLEEFRRKLSYVGPFKNRFQPSSLGNGDCMEDIWQMFGFYINPDLDAQRFLRLPLRDPEMFLRKEEDPLKFKRLEYDPRANNWRWKSPAYRTINFTGCIEEPLEKVSPRMPNQVAPEDKISFFWRKKKDGGYRIYINGEQIPWGNAEPEFKVKKVLSQTECTDDEANRIKREHKITLWDSSLEVARIVPCYDVEEYEGLAALVRKHPEFHPREIFDYSPKEGKVWIGHRFSEIDLRWFRKGDRYYLDTSGFLKQKKSVRRDLDYVYSSAILTAEAIKKKEWQFLGYGSGTHHALWDVEILANHPSIIIRHASAILDYWSAKHAEYQGLTNSDWIRERALNPLMRGLTREEALREVRTTRAELVPKLPGLRELVRQREKEEAEIGKSGKEAPFLPEDGSCPF